MLCKELDARIQVHITDKCERAITNCDLPFAAILNNGNYAYAAMCYEIVHLSYDFQKENAIIYLSAEDF